MISTTPLTDDLLTQLALLSRDAFAGVVARTDAARRMCLDVPAGWNEAALLFDRPMAAYGLWPLWYGRAEAWMLVSKAASPHIVGRASAAARRFLERAQRLAPERLHRVEMWVQSDAPWRRSFAAELRMDEEGTALAWGPDGSDYTLYARLAGDMRA